MMFFALILSTPIILGAFFIYKKKKQAKLKFEEEDEKLEYDVTVRNKTETDTENNPRETNDNSIKNKKKRNIEERFELEDEKREYEHAIASANENKIKKELEHSYTSKQASNFKEERANTEEERFELEDEKREYEHAIATANENKSNRILPLNIKDNSEKGYNFTLENQNFDTEEEDEDEDDEEEDGENETQDEEEEDGGDDRRDIYNKKTPKKRKKRKDGYYTKTYRGTDRELAGNENLADAKALGRDIPQNIEAIENEKIQNEERDDKALPPEDVTKKKSGIAGEKGALEKVTQEIRENYVYGEGRNSAIDNLEHGQSNKKEARNTPERLRNRQGGQTKGGGIFR